MPLSKKSFFCVLLAVCTAASAAAANPPAKPARVTSVEGITEYRLGNGLRVLLFPDPTKQTITVNITYLVGSRNENYGETGMAHLLEHLMFKGTPKHPNIPQELTSHGARPNGTTWFDRTNYFETFRATDENLQWALDLEADRMVHSFIAKKDLDSEMTVVRNEFESGENDPVGVLDQRVLSTAFLWHNYGHDTIGARADIENVPIERLQAFWRTYYQPDNAVLLVAGKFDEEKTLAMINTTFSPIPRPSRALPATYTAEPTQDGERSVTLRRVGDVQALAVAYHVPAGSHPDAPAVEILAEVLGDTPSGRLHKALVDAKKATSVSSFFLDLKEPGFLLLRAEVRQDQSLEDAKTTMLQTIDGAVKTPPSKEEVERARAKILKNIELTMNSADRVGLQMSEWIGAGDWRLFFLNRDRIRKVTPEDVGRAAASLSQALQPHGRRVHPDGQTGTGGDPIRAGRGRPAQGLQGRRGHRRRRGLRSLSGLDRIAHAALGAGRGTEARAPAQEDAGRDGRGRDDAALRRREEPRQPRDGGAADGRHVDARDGPAHAPADQGRVRPAPGPRLDRRRTDAGRPVH